MKKKNRFVGYFVLLMLLVTFAACTSRSKQESTGEYVDDSPITTRVKSLLATDDFPKSFQSDLETYKGTFQLSGFVNSQQALDKAGQIARSVKGVKSTDCALFESPVGSPIEVLHYATNVMVIEIREAQARFDFLDISPGTYALVVVHDENMNGKLDTNWLGAPKEGYGFSNDSKAFLRAPSFSAATFQYDGRNIDLTMALTY